MTATLTSNSLNNNKDRKAPMAASAPKHTNNSFPDKQYKQSCQNVVINTVDSQTLHRETNDELNIFYNTEFHLKNLHSSHLSKRFLTKSEEVAQVSFLNLTHICVHSSFLLTLCEYFVCVLSVLYTVSVLIYLTWLRLATERNKKVRP